VASGEWPLEDRGKRVARRGEEGHNTPTPRGVCVNAVDKGVSERFGVKAVDKGLRA